MGNSLNTGHKPATVRSLYAFDSEWSAWQESADREGLKLNGWARKALNRVSELESALARQRTVEDARSSE